MNVKDINIKNQTYHIFNDIINIKILYLNNIKIDKIFLFTTLDM